MWLNMILVDLVMFAATYSAVADILMPKMVLSNLVLSTSTHFGDNI